MTQKEQAELVGRNIKTLRESTIPSPSQEETAKLLGIPYKRYQSIELGRSLKAAKELVPRLADLWGVPEQRFWSETNGNIASDLGPQSVVNSISLKTVDIGLHEPNSSGKVTLLQQPTKTVEIPADLARLNPKAIAIADDDNLPRFRKGNWVLVVPKYDYPDGCWVAAEIPDELVESPSGEVGPRIAIRRYEYRNGRYELYALNPEAKVYAASSVNIVGLLIWRVVVHADGWDSVERAKAGLPLHAP